LKNTDRVFSCLLFLGGVGHSFGSFAAYSTKLDVLIWALSASLLIFMLGSVNFVRAGRPGDTALAWITLIFNLSFLVSVYAFFGGVIHNLLDPRVIGFTIIVLVLCAMSVRTMNTKQLMEEKR
jgi:hypothetical protein